MTCLNRAEKLLQAQETALGKVLCLCCCCCCCCCCCSDAVVLSKNRLDSLKCLLPDSRVGNKSLTLGIFLAVEQKSGRSGKKNKKKKKGETFHLSGFFFWVSSLSW